MKSIFSNQNKHDGTNASLSPREAFEYLQDNAAILDIRPEYETNFRIFDVPKVFYLNYDSYRENFNSIPRDLPLIIADSVGMQSVEVAKFLISQGYLYIACLAGGVIAWDHMGLPLKKDMGYSMDGSCGCRLQIQKKRMGD